MNNPANICAILTTFNPSENAIANIHALSLLVSHTIVVDDTGINASSTTIKNVFADSTSITLTQNIDNSGISFSLNKGVKLAISMNYYWILTFDDDTIIPYDAISRLISAVEIQQRTMENPLDIFCLARPSQINSLYGSTQFLTKEVAITSGCLFTKILFEKINGFEESYFIDLVDFDFCLKANGIGGKVRILNSPDMQHTVGAPTDYKRFKTITTQNHPPFRYYYHFRNMFPLTRSHATIYPKTILKLWIGMTIILVKIALFEKNRINKIRSILIGIWHGLRKISGKIPDSVSTKISN